MCRHETLGRGMRISLTTSIMTESYRSSHKETELESRIVRIKILKRFFIGGNNSQSEKKSKTR